MAYPQHPQRPFPQSGTPGPGGRPPPQRQYSASQDGYDGYDVYSAYDYDDGYNQGGYDYNQQNNGWQGDGGAPPPQQQQRRPPPQDYGRPGPGGPNRPPPRQNGGYPPGPGGPNGLPPRQGSVPPQSAYRQGPPGRGGPLPPNGAPRNYPPQGPGPGQGPSPGRGPMGGYGTPPPQQGRRTPGPRMPPPNEPSIAMAQDNAFPSFPGGGRGTRQQRIEEIDITQLEDSMTSMNMGGKRRPSAAGNRAPPPAPLNRMPPPGNRNNSFPQQGLSQGYQDPTGYGGGYAQDGPYGRAPSQGYPQQQNLPPRSQSARPQQYRDGPGGPGGPGAYRPHPPSPAQSMFSHSTQRSMTMPQNAPGGGGGAYDTGPTTQWAQAPPKPAAYHAPDSPSYMALRSTQASSMSTGGAGGAGGGGDANWPLNAVNGQANPDPKSARSSQQSSHSRQDSLGDFYDTYYNNDMSDPHNNRTSYDSIPDFDAQPTPTNKRHNSLDQHLGLALPDAAPTSSHDYDDGYSNTQSGDFSQQAHRSRSQPNLRAAAEANGYMQDDAPAVPPLPQNGGGGYGAPQYQRHPSSDLQGQFPLPPRGYPPQPQRTFSEGPGQFNGPMGGGLPARPSTVQPGGQRRPTLQDQPFPPQQPGGGRPMSNPDALPQHPVPIRPGLMNNNSSDMQSNEQGRPGGGPPQRQSQVQAGPVTHEELQRLRGMVSANPSDYKTQLILAKKLVEAASVLADDGGRADTKTRNKNREKYILEGHKMIKKLVSSGFPDAMFYLADCYGQGLLGLEADPKEAFTLYQSAAKAGHAAAAYRTAVCCEIGSDEGGGTRRDPLKAVQWYKRAASLGDTPAMYKMGIILLRGLLGQPKNIGEAINWLKRAADQADEENPHALHELALLYESPTNNERVIRDEAYALSLLQQAADLGYKFSQFRLGQGFEYGLMGLPIDSRMSILWYTRAASQGEHQSELALSGWYLTGSPGNLDQSDTEAYLWARKAACAEPPLPKAMFAMGYYTEIGIGCPRSLEEAKTWYGRAAAYKFPKAQERLEELKRGGARVQKSRERLSRTNQRQNEADCVVM